MRRVYTLLYIWLTNAFDRDIWPNTKLFRKRNSQSDAASTCTCTDTSATQQPAVPVDEQDDVGAIIMDLINEIQQVLPEGSNQLKLALIRVCRSSRALSRVISSTLNRLLSLSRCCSLVVALLCCRSLAIFVWRNRMSKLCGLPSVQPSKMPNCFGILKRKSSHWNCSRKRRPAPSHRVE
jgi:hypothetical protein